MLLTGAHGNVAELGLLGVAFARLSAVPGRLAGAGAVAVTPAAGGRAEAPWRPLVPGPVHCAHAAGESGYDGSRLGEKMLTKWHFA